MTALLKQRQATTLLLLVSFLVAAQGWIARSTSQCQRQFAGTTLQVGSSAADPNPCWQDMYDEDCAMETIFAAQYVAADWIKKLPCAKGLEVSLRRRRVILTERE